MLEQVADWFYDPAVFWGAPFALVALWAIVKRLHDRLRGRGPRR